MEEKGLNIFQKIMIARLKFLESKPTKSGYNKFQNFKYFELVDIVPVATKICFELGLYTHINIEKDEAVMIVMNADNPMERVEYILTAPQVQPDKFNTMLQDVGRCETYIRRYLYMLFLDITENDTVDAADQKPIFKTANNSKAKKQEKQKLSNNMDNTNEIAKSIVAELPENNKVLVFAKIKVKELVDKGIISAEECPKVLAELERLL